MNSQPMTWDADGNLLADGTHTYSWDAENRLVAIAYAGQPTQATTFAYDGLGRRVTITSTPAGGGAVATSYIWCGPQPCQARNASNAVTRAYYAEGEFTPGAPAAGAYYAPDQIGSARRVFTAASAPVYDYDPYGAPLQTTAAATDYVWAGMFNQVDAGLYLTPARAYSSTLGRWLSRDPAGEDADPDGNLYVYVGGNTLNRWDPRGLRPYTPGELAAIIPIYGNQIDYGKVDIRCGAPPWNPIAGIANANGFAITLGNTIYIPPSYYSPDYSTGSAADLDLFIGHESTHVWQYQYLGILPSTIGINSLALQAIGQDPYNTSSVNAQTDFSGLGPEQQANVVERFMDATAANNASAAKMLGAVLKSGGLLPNGSGNPGH
jgi:RHS repeat-associated protein